MMHEEDIKRLREYGYEITELKHLNQSQVVKYRKKMALLRERCKQLE